MILISAANIFDVSINPQFRAPVSRTMTVTPVTVHMIQTVLMSAVKFGDTIVVDVIDRRVVDYENKSFAVMDTLGLPHPGDDMYYIGDHKSGVFLVGQTKPGYLSEKDTLYVLQGEQLFHVTISSGMGIHDPCDERE